MSLEHNSSKSPCNDNMMPTPAERSTVYGEDEKPMPLWFWIMLIVCALYLSYSCFAWGLDDGKRRVSDSVIQAHLEAMRHPLRDSQPSDFYTVWNEGVR